VDEGPVLVLTDDGEVLPIDAYYLGTELALESGVAGCP
jgi:hypothetical protein